MKTTIKQSTIVCVRAAFVAAIVLSVCAGCRTVYYVPEDTPIAGRPQSPTVYDLDKSAAQLACKIFSSALFMRNYETAKTRKNGALPVIVCGNIANMTTQRIQRRLDTARDRIRIALLESALVEAKDDEASGAIASRILSGANGGMENGALVQSLGAHDSPDFLLLGDFRHFEDVGGYNTFKLHLTIHDLSTGKIAWEGIQTMIKL